MSTKEEITINNEEVINNNDSDNDNDEVTKVNKRKKKKPKSKEVAPKTLNPVAQLALQRKKLLEEEEARLKALQEEEERKIKEEEARLKAIQDEKERKIQAKKDKIAAKKADGTYKTKSQKKKERNLLEKQSRAIITTCKINESSDESDESDKEDEITVDYRSPIICIMGHVDTGKTKLMDKIRDTNVQEGEVAGITQQIGATFIPNSTLIKKTNGLNNIKVSGLSNIKLSGLSNIIKIPGLLMIDTPGHEAFSNLRKHGSSLADIVILVIDLVHGLEQQTIESLEILKKSNTKFVIALNKIDRLYGWSTTENLLILDALDHNKETCIYEFDDKVNHIIGQLKTNGINSELYWKNNSPEDTISMCPISAITGEGLPNLLNLIINIAQTDLHDVITFTEELKCIVMEKTNMEGTGITIDALLINGTLNKNDNIIIKTNNGIVKTQIRNLLTPPPNRESRVTSIYDKNNSLKGSIGFKLVANNLENIIIGSEIIIDNNTNIINDTNENNTKYVLQDIGVLVYSSSEGSLEALINYLQTACKPPVPISGIYIGKVMINHINKMIIKNKTTYKELNTILAFDVTVDDDAAAIAKQNNINIIEDGTIYRLFNQYNTFRELCDNQRKDEYRHLLVYPCVINIMKEHIYRKTGPFIFGVKITKGKLHINTPIIIYNKNLVLGRVTSIQKDNKNIDVANEGYEVCIKIESNTDTNIQYGRHFDFNDTLFSHVTKESITVFKKYFKNEIVTTDGKLNEVGTLLKLLETKLKL